MICKHCKKENENMSKFIPVLCKECAKKPVNKNKWFDYIKQKQESKSKSFPIK